MAGERDLLRRAVRRDVLDLGFVRVVSTWGTDETIVQAARVSFGDLDGDPSTRLRLIDYLMRNDHTSPFEMCEIMLHIKLPIFVARQWVRHRTASINEVSARYVELPSDYYIPATAMICEQSKNNKQGRGDAFSPEEADSIRYRMVRTSEAAINEYHRLCDDGVAKEIARMVLPVNVYTEWVWKCDLHNLLRFLRLRLDPHAQYEIRQYANTIAEIVREWVPVTWNAFEKHKLQATNPAQSPTT